MNTRRRKAAACASVLVLALTAACTGDANPSPSNSTTSAQVTAPPDVEEHESGPESPIGFGLQVPSGATQLGPLVRFRSDELIAAYQPELDAAIAQREAALNEMREDALEDGETLAPTTPTPTPVNKPKNDTFRLLEDPPAPDTTVSFMRVDGNPSEVVESLVAQMAEVLPDAGINPRAWPDTCEIEDDRVVRCALEETGETEEGRELTISMTINPGDIETRTASPGSGLRPTLTLSVTYVGDPLLIEADEEESDETDEPLPTPDPGEPTIAPESLIWPRMDVDAPSTDPLLDGDWQIPTNATLLLSGYDPDFVALTTERGETADTIGRSFVSSLSDEGEPTVDTVEDLNEISTTYTAQSSQEGLVATATYVQSGRGNYVILRYMPPTS